MKDFCREKAILRWSAIIVLLVLIYSVTHYMAMADEISVEEKQQTELPTTGDIPTSDDQLATDAVALIPSTEADAGVVDGYYYLRPISSKKRVMDASDQRALKLCTLKYQELQMFYIKSAGEKLYTIRNMSTGLYLAVDGTQIRQEKKDNSLTQKWYFMRRGTDVVIRPAVYSFVLGIQKNRENQEISLSRDENKKGQRWDLIRFIKPDGNWKTSNRVWKDTQRNYKILANIIGAIESGDQIYGNLDYGSYEPPYANSPNEHTITIGWPQCYGPEAQELLKNIFNRDKDSFRKIDAVLPEAKRIEQYIYKNITAMRWKPNNKQKKVIIKLLLSDAGRACQDAQFQNYMKTFVHDCINRYTRNAWAVVMYCEIRHLGGKNSADRIFSACGGNYSLKKIMSVLKRDQYNTRSNYQVGDVIFWDRHECVCTFLETYMK